MILNHFSLDLFIYLFIWNISFYWKINGGGLPFLDYVYINEVQGRSELGQIVLGFILFYFF